MEMVFTLRAANNMLLFFDDLMLEVIVSDAEMQSLWYESDV